MNDESIAKLRTDRRLQGRRGWISEKDFQRELDALPDVSDKIMQPNEEEEAGEVGEPAVAAGPQNDAPSVPEGGGA